MSVLARNRYRVPARSLRPGNNTNRIVGLLQYRSLLNMRLKQSTEGMLPTGSITCIADAFKFRTHGDTRLIGTLERIIQFKETSVNTGSNHRWRKTAPLFIGPDNHLDRSLGLNMVVIQRPNDF